MHQDILKSLPQDDCDTIEHLNYYTQHATHSLNADIAIEELGQLQFPLTKTSIEQLLALSTPAKFGFRDQTLTDTSIRNTQEISIKQA